VTTHFPSTLPFLLCLTVYPQHNILCPVHVDDRLQRKWVSVKKWQDWKRVRHSTLSTRVLYYFALLTFVMTILLRYKSAAVKSIALHVSQFNETQHRGRLSTPTSQEHASDPMLAPDAPQNSQGKAVLDAFSQGRLHCRLLVKQTG
jgi:hypothetical protein